MYGQQFARLEEELFGAVGQLEEVVHAACPAADLDDVAAPNRGRGDLDVGCQCADGGRDSHRFTSDGADWASVEWHGQSHAS
ncbi:hypothetical protein AV521_40630 [Streptomyces sp. IMTB 2501]|nr:hypothetical protein AV521_40630 [Streptomyces sp. IMTB 2501]